MQIKRSHPTPNFDIIIEPFNHHNDFVAQLRIKRRADNRLSGVSLNEQECDDVITALSFYLKEFRERKSTDGEG